MPKDKVSEWSTNPAQNLDVGGIDIAENCAPSNINNAIREVMAQIKDMQTGADGDNFAVAGNLSVTGTSTLTGNVTASGTLAVTGLTTATGGVNGDIFASNGTSKVLENGTDGTNATFTGTASLATNIAGGDAGRIPYNTAAGATAFTAAGTAGQVLLSNGTSAPSFGSSIKADTVKTATGSSVVFSNVIPSWARRITVIFENVSMSGTDATLVQLGTGSTPTWVTTGYVSASARIIQGGTTQNSNSSTAGFILRNGDAARANHGLMTICLLTANRWVASHSMRQVDGADSAVITGGGSADAGATVTSIRVIGDTTNTFDSGSINILFE